jgi:hypothetical protein
MDFEAGWAANGAACVTSGENIGLDALVAACPRLRNRVGPVCSAEVARGLGAQLFNRSRPWAGCGANQFPSALVPVKRRCGPRVIVQFTRESWVSATS